MTSSPTQADGNLMAQQLQASVDQTTSELLAAAGDDGSEGARALLALAGAGPEGLDRVARFTFELMRAFGFCAQGLAADVEAEAGILAALLDGHPGLAWACELYRDNVRLDELNPLLADQPQVAANAQARLNQWLGRELA